MSKLPNLQKVIETTQEAGKILLEYFETDLEIGMKGAEDVVTEADRASERFLLEKLRDLLPGSAFFGEETGFHEGEGYTWVVDPLDGTHNYSIGIPLWACSVGLLDENRVPILGVLDFPTLKKTYWAERGGGAYRNGKTIQVSTGPLGPTSPIGVQSRIRLPEFPPHIEKATAKYCCRSLGAIAYHAAMVAEGNMRACVDLKVKLHDIAAATVILEEAGGVVTDIDGKPIFPLQMNYADLVEYPLPFFAGDPKTAPDLREFLFPDGTPQGIYDTHLEVG
jgi:myo-inositol-1(or 4)-monophosphatase